MFTKLLTIGFVLLLAACSQEADRPPQPSQAPEAAVVAPSTTTGAGQKSLAPVPQYYDKVYENDGSYRPELTVGLCFPLTGGTQTRRGTRGSGISPFTALNNYLAAAGHARVDIESGRVEVIRLPTHGRLVRGDRADSVGYTPDGDYLGEDRLELAAEVEGKRFQLRYYLSIVENYDPEYWSEHCLRESWKIGTEMPAEPGESHLGACAFVYTRNISGEPVRNGLSAASAVMAMLQAQDRAWNDELWKARVLTPPQHGTLVPDTSLEAGYFYTAEPGYSGVDQITFEVSLGSERYQVAQVLQVNNNDPEYEQRVLPALRECPRFTLPGVARVSEDKG